MIGFDVKKCMKASLQGLYWNVWLSWSFGQDWRLKIWIYLRTKKLLISLFASPSSYTYLLHRKKQSLWYEIVVTHTVASGTKSVALSSCITTYTHLPCLLRTSCIVKPAAIDICILNSVLMFFANAIVSSIETNLLHCIKLCNIFWSFCKHVFYKISPVC